MRYGSLEGKWDVTLNDGSEWTMLVPGTLEENSIGYRDLGTNQWDPDDGLEHAVDRYAPGEKIATRLTRKYTYEGPAKISKKIHYFPKMGYRTFLEVERARCLKLQIDGKEVEPYETPTLSTPHVFELVDLSEGEHEITFISDNSYPGLPYDDIVYSSAATDETQTNWNGLLGYVRLRREKDTFIASLRVYPGKDRIKVVVEIDGTGTYSGNISLSSEILEEPVCRKIHSVSGKKEITFEALKVRAGVRRWDEYEGNLYELKAELTGGECKTAVFGMRTFGDNGAGRLALNGRTIFLRGEVNCAEFPESGHCPMSVEEWTRILELYKQYGVNCVRFHSHCPPEAAFTAADRLGMLMQPELSHWNPKDAFRSEVSYSYYRAELMGIIKMLADHPSFVMLTLGNELCTDEIGHERMDELTQLARSLDDTRMYARASNEHYGKIGGSAKSDFYTAQRYGRYDLRGTSAAEKGETTGIQGYINRRYPDTKMTYTEGMDQIRKELNVPVFSFEVGQFEILPDFSELEQFQGISDPVNYKLIRDKVRDKGLEPVWEKYVEATGELACIGYREEIEAVMRTESMSGISLLGLQDFPGQGTALVGMMNAHLCPKPYPFAEPERFRSFFTSRLPLVQLEKYTYENGEVVRADVIIANYGKEEITGALEYTLSGKIHHISGKIGDLRCPLGANTFAGSLEIELEGFERAEALSLTVCIQDIKNTYPLWVYPGKTPRCPQQVYETRCFDADTEKALEMGKSVYLSPHPSADHLPDSIQAQFTTDFWSVGTFTAQEGGMGQWIDADHPLFEEFPTESHTDWQWWPMAVQRAFILPYDMKCIIREMDSYAFLRPMAKLLECKCGKGKVLLSSMELQDLQRYPEARALQAAIYDYMASEKFDPDQEMSPEILRTLVK